ncbi:MAG: chemotaxis protein CheW [Desulfuromonadales bacterium]
MDIAKIRKKAKTLAKPDKDLSEAVPEQEPMSGSGPVENAAETAEVPADQGAMKLREVEPMETAEGLDRIFAMTDDLPLATDESYAAMLHDQAITPSQNVIQYLAFHLDEEEYALDIEQISEIIKVTDFTEIPRSPEYVLGIISLRGVVVPVFDLRCRLNLGAADMTTNSRIVVCRSGDLTVGLLVDNINQVVNLDKDEIEPPPGVLSGLDREMVLGIGRYQDRMVILLQLNHVLNVDLN